MSSEIKLQTCERKGLLRTLLSNALTGISEQRSINIWNENNNGKVCLFLSQNHQELNNCMQTYSTSFIALSFP